MSVHDRLEIRHCTSPQMYKKHWSIPSCLRSISCSAFKLFQSGICPPHCAENAKGMVTDFLMAKFGGFFFVFILDIFIVLDILCFWNITEVVFSDLTTPSSRLSRLLFFCLPLSLFLFPCCTHTDYCWTTLLMFHGFKYILLTSTYPFPGL